MTLLALAGCSRRDESAPPAPPREPPAVQSLTAPSPSVPAAPTSTTSTTAVAVAASRAFNPVNAEQLEADYLQSTDLRTKVSLLDDITGAEPAAAVQVLSRLFYLETDTALREEVLNSLVYVDGEESSKLELLAAALTADQPNPVRHAALEVMVEEGDLGAVTVLETFANDTDPDIRDAVAAAIEELKTAKSDRGG